MTKFFPIEKHCFVCNKKSTYDELVSTNSFGYMDLDTRPPEMQRSTIIYWVQECPYCGYCNDDVGSGNKEYLEIVKSESYLLQLHNKDYPRLANRFLCKSFLNEMDKSYKKSAFDSLHAAWACDDSSDYEDVAIKCRQRSYDFFLLAKAQGEFIFQNEVEDALILIDLLRRMKLFEEALNRYTEIIDKNSNPELRKILDYQKVLIKNRDSQCHNLEGAQNLI